MRSRGKNESKKKRKEEGKRRRRGGGSERSEWPNDAKTKLEKKALTSRQSVLDMLHNLICSSLDTLANTSPVVWPRQTHLTSPLCVANLLCQIPVEEDDDEQLSVECSDESDELVFRETGTLAKLMMMTVMVMTTH